MTKGTLVPCWARTMLTEMHNVTKRHYLNSFSTFKQQRSPKHHLIWSLCSMTLLPIPHWIMPSLGFSDPALTWFLLCLSNHLHPKFLTFCLYFSGFHPHLPSLSIQLDLKRKITYGQCQGMEGGKARINCPGPTLDTLKGSWGKQQ